MVLYFRSFNCEWNVKNTNFKSLNWVTHATFFILHRYTLSFTTSPQFSKKYDIDISTKRIKHSNPLKPFVRDCTTPSKLTKRHLRPTLPSVQPLPLQSINSSKHSKISTALPLSWWTSIRYFRRWKKGRSLDLVNNCFVIIVSKGTTNILFIKFKRFSMAFETI